MKKYVIGFIVGLVILAVIFCITVLVMGSVHDRNFVDEIKSWDKTEKTTVVDKTEDKTNADIKTDVNNQVYIVLK